MKFRIDRSCSRRLVHSDVFTGIIPAYNTVRNADQIVGATNIYSRTLVHTVQLAQKRLKGVYYVRLGQSRLTRWPR